MNIRTTDVPATVPGTGSAAVPASTQLLPDDAATFAQAIQPPSEQAIRPGQSGPAPAAEPLFPPQDRAVPPASVQQVPDEAAAFAQALQNPSEQAVWPGQSGPAPTVEPSFTPQGRAVPPASAQQVPDGAAAFAQALQSPSEQVIWPGQTGPTPTVEPSFTPQGREPAMGENSPMQHGKNNVVSRSDGILPGQINQMNQMNRAGQMSRADKAAPDVNTVPRGEVAHFIESLREGPALPANATQSVSEKLAGDGGRADRTDKAGSTAKTGKSDSRGDAILNALGGMATPPADAPVPVASVGDVGQTSSPGLAEISGMNERVLTQLVDSILVSAKEGQQEVHIKVQDAVLKDTNIVVRMQDGHLEVQLQTSDNYSSQLLHQNVDSLRQALEGRQFGESVWVKVEDRAAGPKTDDSHADGQNTGRDARQEQGGQDQRSRGHFLWGGDAG